MLALLSNDVESYVPTNDDIVIGSRAGLFV